MSVHVEKTLRGFITLESGRDLDKAKSTYCEVSLFIRKSSTEVQRNFLFRTDVAAKSKEPVWRSGAPFAKVAPATFLEVSLYEAGRKIGPITKHEELIGTTVIPLEVYAEKGTVEEWYSLFNKKNIPIATSVRVTFKIFWDLDDDNAGNIFSGLLQPLDKQTANMMLLPHAPVPQQTVAPPPPVVVETEASSDSVLHMPDPTFIPLNACDGCESSGASILASAPVPASDSLAVKRRVASALVMQLVSGLPTGSFDVYDNWSPEWFLRLMHRLTAAPEAAVSEDTELSNDLVLDVYGEVCGIKLDSTWPMPQFLGKALDDGFVIRMVHDVVDLSCRIDATPARTLTEQMEGWASRSSSDFNTAWKCGMLIGLLLRMRFGAETVVGSTLAENLECLSRLSPNLPAPITAEEGLAFDVPTAVMWLYSLMLHLQLTRVFCSPIQRKPSS